MHVTVMFESWRPKSGLRVETSHNWELLNISTQPASLPTHEDIEASGHLDDNEVWILILSTVYERVAEFQLHPEDPGSRIAMPLMLFHQKIARGGGTFCFHELGWRACALTYQKKCYHNFTKCFKKCLKINWMSTVITFIVVFISN